jgi:acetylornithine deacetylase
VYRLRLRAEGRAAHSGYPELGESAIEKLIDGLVALRRIEWPRDEQLGTTTYTVGLISGGVAPNVVPSSAEAELLVRTVGSHDAVRDAIRSAIGEGLQITEVLEVPPVRLRTVEGYDTAVFSYTTDIPFLERWGTPLLLGPGSIHVAHTDDEHVLISELHRGVTLYTQLARTLLASVAYSASV